MSQLVITELVLLHCNIVNNQYQRDVSVFLTFVPNESFGELLNISPTNHIIFQKDFFQSSYTLNYGLPFKLQCHYNHGHNILRLFDTLPNFLFTASETKRD